MNAVVTGGWDSVVGANVQLADRAGPRRRRGPEPHGPAHGAIRIPAGRRARSWAWLGIVPFLAFALLFLILPTMHIVVGAFRNPAGEFTLANIANLFPPSILAAFWISIRISFASAFLGCVIGFAVAAAVVLGGLPRLAARAGPDLLRRRLELRRGAARLRLPGDARAARARHACSCASGSASTSTRWASTC